MDLFLRECFSYLGVPYKWGGSNPVEGFDCSGFAQWMLMSCGVDPKGDQTAQGLFDYFNKTYPTIAFHKIGTLCFYGQSVTKISHVAIAIDPYRIIEAGGGGSKTITRDDAAKSNACVRIRPINARGDLVAKIHPSYAKIGMI